MVLQYKRKIGVSLYVMNVRLGDVTEPNKFLIIIQAQNLHLVQFFPAGRS